MLELRLRTIDEIKCICQWFCVL